MDFFHTPGPKSPSPPSAEKSPAPTVARLSGSTPSPSMQTGGRWRRGGEQRRKEEEGLMRRVGAIRGGKAQWMERRKEKKGGKSRGVSSGSYENNYNRIWNKSEDMPGM